MYKRQLEALLDEHSHFEQEHPESVSDIENVIREKELLDYLGNCTNSTAGRKSVDTENRLDERKQGDNL